MAELDDLRRAMEAAETRVSPEEVAHVRATLAYGLAEADDAAEARSSNNRDAFDRFAKLTTILLAVLVVVQLVLGVVAVKLSASNGDRIAEQKMARKNAILVSCGESNKRHREAIPVLISLTTAGAKPPTAEARELQAASVRVLTAEAEGKKPDLSTPISKRAKAQADGFLQILAPAYDCRARLAKFTKA